MVATPRLVVRDAVVDEKDGSVLVPVLLGGPAGQASDTPVTVQYTTSDGTATAGVDYAAISGTLNFAPGQTVKNVVVPILDAGREAVEELRGEPRAASTNASIADGTGIVVIGASTGRAGSAATPAAAVSAPADVAVDEADGYVDLPVQALAAPSVDARCRSRYSTHAAARRDLGHVLPRRLRQHRAATLTFAPGETIKVVRVQLLDCVDVEGVDTFRFNLTLAGQRDHRATTRRSSASSTTSPPGRRTTRRCPR